MPHASADCDLWYARDGLLRVWRRNLFGADRTATSDNHLGFSLDTFSSAPYRTPQRLRRTNSGRPHRLFSPLLPFSLVFCYCFQLFSRSFDRNPPQISVLGLTFPYNQAESKVQPGFTFMDISDRYVIARGAGGGLALWLRQDSV